MLRGHNLRIQQQARVREIRHMAMKNDITQPQCSLRVSPRLSPGRYSTFWGQGGGLGASRGGGQVAGPWLHVGYTL